MRVGRRFPVGSMPARPRKLDTRKRMVRRRKPVTRSGAQKRQARGRAAVKATCRVELGRVVAVDGKPADGVAVCGRVLHARHGWLRCPIHG